MSENSSPIRTMSLYRVDFTTLVGIARFGVAKYGYHPHNTGSRFPEEKKSDAHAKNQVLMI
jgi:hypothetical protein